MREYENIAYLDLQKTGSTTIKTVLDTVLDEDEVHRTSHGGIHEDFDHSKLCFISVREPLSLYISLFNFGAGDDKGSLRRSLTRKGYNDYFDPTPEGFARWLDLVLDPLSARLLRRDYATSAYETIGFLSFRLLYLSVPNSVRRMQKDKFRERDQIRELFNKRVYEDYVRLENLSGDLFGLLSRNAGRLRLRYPLTTAEDLTARIPVRNASAKVPGLKPDTVPEELRQRVREREWLFYEAFGYDTDPKGRPPKCLSLEPSADTGVRRRGERKAQRKARYRERRAARS